MGRGLLKCLLWVSGSPRTERPQGSQGRSRDHDAGECHNLWPLPCHPGGRIGSWCPVSGPDRSRFRIVVSVSTATCKGPPAQPVLWLPLRRSLPPRAPPWAIRPQREGRGKGPGVLRKCDSRCQGLGSRAVSPLSSRTQSRGRSYHRAQFTLMSDHQRPLSTSQDGGCWGAAGPRLSEQRTSVY